MSIFDYKNAPYWENIEKEKVKKLLEETEELRVKFLELEGTTAELKTNMSLFMDSEGKRRKLLIDTLTQRIISLEFNIQNQMIPVIKSMKADVSNIKKLETEVIHVVLVRGARSGKKEYPKGELPFLMLSKSILDDLPDFRIDMRKIVEGRLQIRIDTPNYLLRDSSGKEYAANKPHLLKFDEAYGVYNITTPTIEEAKIIFR